MDIIYICDGKQSCGHFNNFCGVNYPNHDYQCYHTKDPKHALHGAVENESEIKEDRFEIISGVYWERRQKDES